MNILSLLRGLFQGPGLQQSNKSTPSNSTAREAAPQKGAREEAAPRQNASGGSSSALRNTGNAALLGAGAGIAPAALGAAALSGTLSGSDLLGVLRSGGASEDDAKAEEEEATPAPEPEEPKGNIWTDSPEAQSWAKLNKDLEPEHRTTQVGNIRVPVINGHLNTGVSSKLTPDPDEKAEIEKKALEEEQTKRALTGFNGDRKELSREEYLALSPRQRNAIDFNTALVAAVEADKALAGTEMDEDYTKRVDALFGKDGGSDSYSPNTVALLESIGFEDKKANDLDNFLSLQAAITDDDIANLGMQDWTPEEGDRRGEYAMQISESIQPAIAESLRNGQSLLDSFRSSSGAEGAPRQFNMQEQENLDLLFDLAIDPSATDEEFAGYVGDIERELGISPNETAKYIDLRLSGLEQEHPDPEDLEFIAGVRDRFVKKAG